MLGVVESGDGALNCVGDQEGKFAENHQHCEPASK